MLRTERLGVALRISSLLVLAATTGLTPALPQNASGEDNPNYPARNPFYFEGKIDYELLRIDQPATAWEYMQRGIHRQDDLEDYRAAVEDYRQALELNNVANGSCQIVDSVPANFGDLDPPPCMFTLRLRLGYLLIHDDPEESIRLFKEVLDSDPLRLEVNFLIGEAHEILAEEAKSQDEKEQYYQKAIEALQAELALTPPVNDPSLSPDEANNAHTHWLLAEIYEKQGQYDEAIGALESYLKATTWHSDVLPWRIPLAEKKIEQLRDMVTAASTGILRRPRIPSRGRIRRAAPSE